MADLQKQTTAWLVNELMTDLAGVAADVTQRARDVVAMELPKHATEEMAEGLDVLLIEIGDAAITLRDASDATGMRIRHQVRGHGWAPRGDDDENN